MTDVPSSMTVGDLEFKKFQEDADDCVAVNVVGATRDSSGVELSTALAGHFRRQEALLSDMTASLNELLAHIRYISGLGYDPDNDQPGG